jgi:fructose-1,6-bisphosphatase I
MLSIFENIKEIAFEIEKAVKHGEFGYSNRKNRTGDNQLKLDILCDTIIENGLSKNPLIKALISEEKEDKVMLNENGEYTVCYDPLDGSSIVDVNLSVGSIFGIYRSEPTSKTLLASAYILFGPRLEIVTATKDIGVKHYKTLDNSSFDDGSEIFLKERGKINAPGGTQKNWSEKHKRFIDSLFKEGYRLRYSGGMVPDLHHILLKGGGIFSYPATSDRAKGKLRALFEVFPFALIFEKAGGEAVDDRGKRILEYEIEGYHDTLPCFFGSKREIEKMKKGYGIEL